MLECGESGYWTLSVPGGQGPGQGVYADLPDENSCPVNDPARIFRAMSTTDRQRPDRFHVLGVAVDRLTVAQAADRVDALIAAGGVGQVVTVNPEFVIAARRHRQFRRVLNQASLAVADGIGIVWAARILGDCLPERVGGIDLAETLAERCAGSGRRLFLLGGAPGVAEAAAEALLARFPSLVVAGTYAGSPEPSDFPAIRARIHAARPHLLLVAFGAPAQDLWIARHQSELAVPVAMGVGGAFDFLAGRIRRAPRWLQQLGLEWLYRLALQPWRWRRMLALPRFGGMVVVLRLAGPPR